MNIEILAAYAAHDLKMRHSDGRIRTLGFVTSSFKKVISIQSCLSKHSDWLPILRPLSDIYQELPVNESGSVSCSMVEWLHIKYKNKSPEDVYRYIINGNLMVHQQNKLLADHYNVFNLPEGEYIRKV